MPVDVATLPPLVLAYVGDAVYELCVRTHLVASGLARTGALHGAAVRYVQAASQARLVSLLEPDLTPGEREVLRRGRNAHAAHPPRGADVLAYRYSTALECLFGYLYLRGEQERLQAIFSLVASFMDQAPEI